ncbi:Na+/H+ antiporter NhaA [Agromyces archimandritae]|uniref:Na(+)/H(+) antiporter NhaA n=1 Tax=Agromyces archimandritae TaxID=2781962 RepID=A0A975FMD7_9MICO|nr:Na+/H+ antiporter NhaA [Agromyces archimandritae]QTX04153.1 Na+/H+ antiporter NhaA [Agromyces archimandritae]
MRLLRSERFSALLLLLAAVLGLVLANTAIGPGLLELKGAHLGWAAIGLDLSIGHWVSDGLLAIFFFIVAVELRRELVVGELASPAKALLPAIAAAGGVITPALVYLLIAVVLPGGTGGAGLEAGWPIPTATDIAFALGVLGLFGRWIPGRVRVFLLALAVLDDLVGILIIAFFFTDTVELPFLGLAAACVAVFGVLSRMLKPRAAWMLARRPAWPIALALVVLGVLAWYFVLRSGVHATIAGVLLGLVIARSPGAHAEHRLEPFSNGIVLPLFAFSAAAVAIPAVAPAELSPAFWAIVVALPVGKIVGITLFGTVGGLIAARRSGPSARIPTVDVIVVGVLGGIGFTVALLMNELAFGRSHAVADQGTLAVLLGSGIAMLASAFAVTARSRHYARTLARRG